MNNIDLTRYISSVVTMGNMQVTPARTYSEEDFKKYKQFAKKAARELHYGHDVECAIHNATTEAQITRILHTARNKLK